MREFLGLVLGVHLIGFVQGAGAEEWVARRANSIIDPSKIEFPQEQFLAEARAARNAGNKERALAILDHSILIGIKGAIEQRMEILGPMVVLGSEAMKNGDYRTAWRELISPAVRGHAEAEFLIGKMIGEGKGTPLNACLATIWFHLAAVKEHGMAQFYLGHAYLFGLGVLSDSGTAYFWYRKAQKNGVSDARKAAENQAKERTVLLTDERLAQIEDKLEIDPKWMPDFVPIIYPRPANAILEALDVPHMGLPYWACNKR